MKIKENGKSQNIKTSKKFVLLIITLSFIYLLIMNNNYDILNENYLNIQNNLNLTFINKLNKKIAIAIYAFGIKNGGRARVTSLLLNYFVTINIFQTFLFTRREKEDNEYLIPQNIPRITIKHNIIKIIKKKKLIL